MHSARLSICFHRLTTKPPLRSQPATLAYKIVASQAGIPTIHWVGKRDHDQLSRLCTGPLRSPYRQAILRFLHNRDSPQSIPDILEATSYDREAGRKMLLRMKMVGELVSPARGLYTTAHHPSLLHLTNESSSVPTVANVASVASPSAPPVPSVKSAAPHAPTVPVSDLPTSMLSSVSHVANVASVASLSPPPAPSAQNNSLSVSHVANVPYVSNPNLSHRENGIGIGGDKKE